MGEFGENILLDACFLNSSIFLDEISCLGIQFFVYCKYRIFFAYTLESLKQKMKIFNVYNNKAIYL